jgi:subtilase family serine protease
MGVGAGVPSTFWSVSGNPLTGGYILAWALQVGNTTNPPLVTSISYGDTEMDYFTKFGSWQYIIRMNVELAKMAARGLTVLAGAGDAGTLEMDGSFAALSLFTRVPCRRLQCGRRWE